MLQAMKPAPGEKYTIRRKVFKFFGAAFHIYGPDGSVVGYCDQKAFKLREDLRVYTDESKSNELLRISARQIIDLGATYDVLLQGGERVGSFRRAGLRSTFYRDSWSILNHEGQEVAKVSEDSAVKAIIRRLVDNAAALIPQRFSVTDLEGRTIATLRTHFNPFVYRLGVTIVADHPEMDELMVLALGCAVAAIEGRQG